MIKLGIRSCAHRINFSRSFVRSRPSSSKIPEPQHSLHLYAWLSVGRDLLQLQVCGEFPGRPENSYAHHMAPKEGLHYDRDGDMEAGLRFEWDLFNLGECNNASSNYFHFIGCYSDIAGGCNVGWLCARSATVWQSSRKRWTRCLSPGVTYIPRRNYKLRLRPTLACVLKARFAITSCSTVRRPKCHETVVLEKYETNAIYSTIHSEF